MLSSSGQPPACRSVQLENQQRLQQADLLGDADAEAALNYSSNLRARTACDAAPRDLARRPPSPRASAVTIDCATAATGPLCFLTNLRSL